MGHDSYMHTTRKESGVCNYKAIILEILSFLGRIGIHV